MKYALESLPELIGEIQFRDLCESVGMDCSLQVPTGEEFAKAIQSSRDHRLRQLLAARSVAGGLQL